TSALTTSPTSVSATSPVHEVTSAPATSPTPSHSTGSPVTTSTQSTAPQVSAGLSFFFLSFYITNLQFNSSLEDPSSKYYQELQRNVSALVGSGVPGWGIALLVLVCVLLALAIIYFIALAVCQCRRKNCGQLDLFPTRDTYHPMSEYPTYHTHGRYVPPGSTRRSPYEEESAGNGGSGLSYTSPPVAATSAHLAGTCTFTKGQPGAGSLS
uniref:Mucin-1 n=1 Tax=Oryctolagus cuniculus TaxID=9986 RepID=G1TLJ5_RABIT